MQSVLLFGDDFGVPQLLRHIPKGVVRGIVGASIRSRALPTLKEVARRYDIPVLVQPPFHADEYPEFLEHVRSLAPDLCIVNSYSMLVRPDLLAIPKFGAINIHGGLLPFYRGCNPIQWAILNNETETGVTMHLMTEEFDAGDIIATRKVPLLFRDTWVDVRDRLIEMTDEMLKEEIPKILSLRLARIPQDERLARYCPRRKPEDGVIQWDWTVRHIYNLIRALVRPHPGAFCYVNDAKMVFEAYLPLQAVVNLKYGSVGKQVLENDRVQILPLDFIDLPLRVGDQPRVIGNLFSVPHLPSDSIGERFFKEQVQDNAVLFQIISRHTKRLVGLGGFHRLDPLAGRMHLSLLGTNDGGDLQSSVPILLDFAWRELEMKAVALALDPNQYAEFHDFERLGFVRDGDNQGEPIAEGPVHTLVRLCILRQGKGV